MSKQDYRRAVWVLGGVVGFLMVGCGREQGGEGWSVWPGEEVDGKTKVVEEARGVDKSQKVVAPRSGEVMSNTVAELAIEAGGGSGKGVEQSRAGAAEAIASKARGVEVEKSQSVKEAGAEQAVVYVNGRKVGVGELAGSMLEMAGGQVLAEFVLDRGIEERLSRLGIELREEDVAAERVILMKALNEDADQAERVLAELRERRGLGEKRFGELLRRNAGLRGLVRGQSEATGAEVQREFLLAYGERYETRLVTVEALAEAAEVSRRAREGEDFAGLAAEFSTDPSRAEGGRVGAISAHDPTVPDAVRKATVKLGPGGVSDPVVLERGYAVLRLERKIEAKGVQFDDVKESLARRVRQRTEQVAMGQLVREIIGSADVVVTDPALERGWKAQKRMMMESGR